MEEKLHTLCQLFVKIDDPKICDESVHLQLYTYNDLYLRALQNKFGQWEHLLKYPIKQFLERLIIIYGYLHSNISSELTVTLHRDGADSRLVVQGSKNRKAKLAAIRVSGKLLKNWKLLRGIPGMPVLDSPGGGNHSGGTFPMREHASEFETDILGRPYGFQHIHIVDSSVFPSLPATTITLTIMANAHRIASMCEE
jgi:choline dehydrogenase-like flavoprotein